MCSCFTSQTIVGSSEAEIKCGREFRVDSALGIIVYNPNITNEYKGYMGVSITFDTLIHDTAIFLKIINIETRWIRLVDSRTNEIIFNEVKTSDININNDIFHYYENKLFPILKEYQCWYVDDNKKHKFYRYYSYNFPFKVVKE